MNKVILKFSFDHFINSGAFLGHGILVQFKCRSIGIFEILIRQKDAHMYMLFLVFLPYLGLCAKYC